MLSKIFEPFNFHESKRDRLKDKIAEAKAKKTLEMKDIEKALSVLKGRTSLMGSKILKRNDIIMNEHGMKFLMLDPENGKMMCLDWEEDQYKFTPVASAHPEDAPDDGLSEALDEAMEEEDLYDITPEDRKKLRHGGII